MQKTRGKNSHAWALLKECVAIVYFHWLVNRKQEKRCEFFRKYLHYGASYAPAAGGSLKEGSSWMQGTKIQHSNSKTLFLASISKPSLSQHRFAAPTVDTWGWWEDDPHALGDGGSAEARRLRAHLAGEQARRLKGDVVQVNPRLRCKQDFRSMEWNRACATIKYGWNRRTFFWFLWIMDLLHFPF